MTKLKTIIDGMMMVIDAIRYVALCFVDLFLFR